MALIEYYSIQWFHKVVRQPPLEFDAHMRMPFFQRISLFFTKEKSKFDNRGTKQNVNKKTLRRSQNNNNFTWFSIKMFSCHFFWVFCFPNRMKRKKQNTDADLLLGSVFILFVYHHQNKTKSFYFSIIFAWLFNNKIICDFSSFYLQKLTKEIENIKFKTNPWQF